jgi:tetratricopeptide (TPR) repeat protein
VPGRAAAAAAAYEKAIALGEARLRVNPADAETTAELAHFHARLGHRDRATQLAASALQRDPENNQVQYFAALVSAQLGDAEAAIGHLERAVALGYQRQLLPVDPGLAALRKHPRFAALVATHEK